MYTIREGMTVYSADGHKLGKVTSVGPSDFVIEKGLVFTKDYLARQADVASVAGDDVRLVVSRDELFRLDEAATTKTSPTGIQEGMKVVDSEGQDVGKVGQCGANDFVIEKGVFIPRDHLAHYADVARVVGDEVHLRVTRDVLLSSEWRMRREERGEWAGHGSVEQPLPPARVTAFEDETVKGPPDEPEVHPDKGRG